MKGRFIEWLGDSRQVAERCRKQRRIIVTGDQHERNAEARQFWKHVENLTTTQVNVQEGAVGAVLPDRINDVADFRNGANDLAAEMMKHPLEIESDEALVFNNQNS